MDGRAAAVRRIVELDLAILRHRLRVRFPDLDAPGDRDALEREREGASRLAGRPAPIDFVRDAFSLTPFERDVLLFGIAVHLDPDLLQDKSRTPTPAMALEIFADGDDRTFLPTSPLRHHRLIELGNHASTLLRPIVVDERLVWFVRGFDTHDERIQHLVEPIRAAKLAPSEKALASEVASALASIRKGDARPVIDIVGAGGQRRVAHGALASLGGRIVELVPSRLPSHEELDATARLLVREATLSRTAYFIDGTSQDVRSICEHLETIVLLATREPVDLSRPTIVLRAPRMRASDQASLWKHALGPDGIALNGQVEGIAQQFDLDGDTIERLAADLKRTGEVTSEMLWSACRQHAARALDGRVTRIEARNRWNDIVLPDDSLSQLREIEGQVRARGIVFERWGFQEKLSRGRGTAVMFVGSSGTGKTLAAEILARELDLELLRIDLAGVVDKYIGETEKNLRRVFETADTSGAILFFDEADALFATRTDVKSSHDRYANVEVNYLLQLMEEYRGVAILATNRRASIDRAFLRRLRFVVEFPHPDAPLRKRIWQGVFPRDVPLDAIDFDALARLDITGGSIRTIALNAALAAANAREPVRMSHLMAAARREYVKLDKIVTQAEFGAPHQGNR